MSARSMSFQERGERQKRIAETYASGVPSERVAEMFGVSGHWVRSIARLYGVSRGYRAPKTNTRSKRATQER